MSQRKKNTSAGGQRSIISEKGVRMGEVVGFVKREPREELKEEAKQVEVMLSLPAILASLCRSFST